MEPVQSLNPSENLSTRLARRKDDRGSCQETHEKVWRYVERRDCVDMLEKIRLWKKTWKNLCAGEEKDRCAQARSAQRPGKYP